MDRKKDAFNNSIVVRFEVFTAVTVKNADVSVHTRLHDATSQKTVFFNSIVTCIFIADLTFFTEPLLSSDGGIYIDTDRWEGFKKYNVDMGPRAMIYIPSFLKIC
jgi:hypothetical protein